PPRRRTPMPVAAALLSSAPGERTSMRQGAAARAAENRRPGRQRRAIENIDIARIFDQIADLLEIQGGNPFRVRAYRTAARTVQSLAVPAASLAAEGRLDELPGIGADLAGKIATILETGTLPLLDELAARTPAGLVELLRIPG